MAQSVEKILNDELDNLKASVMKRYEESGHMASGSTQSAFESYLQSPTQGILEGAVYSGVLQRGRRPGKLPYDFKEILKRWIEAKGLTFNSEADMNRFIYFVSKKIREEGTTLYRSGQTIDIFDTPINDFEANLTNRLATYFTSTIQNEIFKR